MPKRPLPDPTLLAIIAELIARAERGPPPAWKPEPGATVARYGSPRFARHPCQLEILFHLFAPPPASADGGNGHDAATVPSGRRDVRACTEATRIRACVPHARRKDGSAQRPVSRLMSLDGLSEERVGRRPVATLAADVVGFP